MTDYDSMATDAERGVLCAVMWGGATTLAQVRDMIDGSSFRLPHHETIWNAIIGLDDAGAPVESKSVNAALINAKELGRGLLTTEYWTVLLRQGTNSADAAYYAGIVRANAKRRRVLAFASKLEQAIGQSADDDLDAVMARMLDEMEEITAGSADAADVVPHLAALPIYPVNDVPGPLGNLIKEGVQSGLHPCLVGGAGLAALGAVTGTATVEVYERSWEENPSLWVPLMGPPGAGKSPAMEFAHKRLQDLDAGSREQYIVELEEWREAKGKGKSPVDLTRIQQDATTEAIVRWLAAGDGTGAIVADELTAWLRGLNKYRAGGSDGGDRARWLANWAGASWSYIRVTGGVNLMVRRPVVTICGGLQTELHHLLGPEDDGFRVRWLPHIAQLDTTLKPKFGTRDLTAWNGAIDRLYATRSPRRWTLGGESSAAFKIWSEARDRWKRQAGAGDESAATAGALVKADKQAARVALVLAESMNAAHNAGTGGTIPEEAMVGAVAIVDYSLSCWRTLPSQQALTLSRTAETLDQAVDRLAAWLESHGGKAARRELARAHVAGARTAGDLDALLKRYEQRYPGSLVKERSGNRGPRAEVVYAPRRGSTGG